MTPKILKLIFLFIVFSISGYTQNKEECRVLIAKGRIEEKNKNYAEAIRYYGKAELLAEQNDWQEQLVIAKGTLGALYKELSNYNEALRYYQQAVTLSRKDAALEEKRLIILNNIGLLYQGIEDHQSALKYYLEAYPIACSKNMEYAMVLLAVNIADIYNKNGKSDKARNYLDQVKDIVPTGMLSQAWQINYADSYYRDGDIERAKELAENLLHEISNYDKDCYICLVELLSKIYQKEDKIDQAISFAEKGLKTAELKDKIILYGHLAALHNRLREHATALHYKDSLIGAKDSLSALINRNLFEINKAKIDIQEYQETLKITREKQKRERNIYIAIIVFGCLLLFFIYYNSRNKLLKVKTEKILVEDKDRIARLELQKLRSNVAEKNQKLSLKTQYLASRNELILQIIATLKETPELMQDKAVADCVRTLRNYLKTDEQWDDFIEHFEKVNPEFINLLKQRHPDLSSNDIRFISYVYMGLNVKEISEVFNITYNATRIRKKRILEKMSLDTETSLIEYLMTLYDQQN